MLPVVSSAATADRATLAEHRLSAEGHSQLFIAPHADEWPCDVEVCFDAEGRVCFADEGPDDRDIDGTLWERWSGSPTGPQSLAEHHPARQRHVMETRRCAVCARDPDRQTDGVLWLLHAHDVSPSGHWPRDVLTATPAICRNDAQKAIRACHALQDGYVALRVREAELVGVRGTLYTPGAPPQPDQIIRFHEPAIHRVVARQLILRLRDVQLDETTMRTLSHDTPHADVAHRAPAGVPTPGTLVST
ncbi:hypothetical protein [Streptomyces noursei]|uniref:hypothetical protein n=1 Tax=Streptomyces noursei TaxID=1971 RepID=UPI0016791E32|nr:hypothetical protein [Streptomyces noursei]MCZ1021336.1 hypothetical protein [Streptomyces noursei]GGX51772.1 hypothetical protein GCM10010341_86530 [Streptomyces noursei]